MFNLLDRAEDLVRLGELSGIPGRVGNVVGETEDGGVIC